MRARETSLIPAPWPIHGRPLVDALLAADSPGEYLPLVARSRCAQQMFRTWDASGSLSSAHWAPLHRWSAHDPGDGGGDDGHDFGPADSRTVVLATNQFASTPYPGPPGPDSD